MAAGISLMDFFLEIGIKADTLKLKDLVSTIGELNLKSAFTALGLGAMYEGLEKVMGVGVQTTMSLEKFHAVTGIAMKDGEQFAHLAEKYGVGFDEALGSVQALQESVLQLLQAGNQKPFLWLGLKPTIEDTKNILRPGGIMDQLVERMHDPRYNTQFRADLLNQMGGGSLTLALSKIKDLQSEMKGMPFTSDEDREKLLEYNEMWRQIGETFTTVETLIAARFGPTLKAIGDILLGSVRGVDTMASHLNTLLDKLEEVAMAGGALTLLMGVLTENGALIGWGAKAMAGGAIMTGLSHGTDIAKFITTDIAKFITTDIAKFITTDSTDHSFNRTGRGDVTNHVNVTVNAKTNADPKAIAAQINEEISTQLLVASQEKHYGIK